MRFVARVKLLGEDGKVTYCNPNGRCVTETINHEKRLKKLRALLRLLRQQKLEPKVSYSSDNGDLFALVRVKK